MICFLCKAINLVNGRWYIEAYPCKGLFGVGDYVGSGTYLKNATVKVKVGLRG